MKHNLCVMHSFFLICDCRDSLDFEVFYTSMKDPRLRYSAMKSAWRMGANSDIDDTTEVYKSYYKYFNSGYMCVMILEKKMCTNEEAVKHCETLTHLRKEKFKDSKAQDTLSNVVSFNKDTFSDSSLSLSLSLSL